MSARGAALAAVLAAPLAGLAVLLAVPRADFRWEHHPSHFWLVLGAAAVSATLAVSTGTSARARGDARVYLVSLAFLAAAGFLGLHALATPGVLLETSSVGFAISTPIGLLLASVFAAASAAELEGRTRLIERLHLVRIGLVVALVGWGVASLTLTPRVADPAVPERGSAALAIPAIVAVALYAFAIVRYLDFWSRRRSNLLVAISGSFLLLGEAAIATAASRNWQASWWEWHVLILLALGLVAVAARREWREERYSPLYLDETVEAEVDVSVLFADLAGFTTWAENHEPGEVATMLNEYFDAVVPEVERDGGVVDRLIGDAVMAVFNLRGDQPDHAARAARSALALQRAAAAVARLHPEWPRFRVGVNSGHATAAVLGTAGARTYSVVGDAVNVAARIEQLAPEGGVVVGGATVAALRNATLEPLGAVAVKGRSEPVEAHLLVALPD